MMTELEALKSRHSVRQYKEDAVSEESIKILQDEIAKINKEQNLNFQLVVNDPNTFTNFLAHYGNFTGVRNYLAIIGKKDRDVDVGYYTEKLVLLIQSLGMNSCICASSFSKSKALVTVGKDERFYLGVCFGYGVKQGADHKNKPVETLFEVESGEAPEWFKKGMEAALMAPTALNQQKFKITLKENGKCRAISKFGTCSKMDLGIVMYNFEVGAGKENVIWE